MRRVLSTKNETYGVEMESPQIVSLPAGEDMRWNPNGDVCFSTQLYAVHTCTRIYTYN